MTMSVFNTYAALIAAAPTAGDTALLLGYYAKGDGGGGNLYWDSASTATDNGGTIIQPSGGGAGRWFRIYDGPLDVKWFGAKGDGSNDDHAAIQAAADYTASVSTDGSVYLSAGLYLINTEITVPSGVNFIGDGGTISQLLPQSCSAFKYDFISGFGNSTIRDLGLTGTNCTTEAAIYQTATSNSDDQLYGLTFDNLLIQQFNVGIVLHTVHFVTIRNCWMQQVTSGIQLAGLCLGVFIHDNKIIYAGGCGSGDQYGIRCTFYTYTTGTAGVGALRPEGIRITSANGIYGFATGVSFDGVVGGLLEDADIAATVDGVTWSTATGLVVRSNYIEIDGSAGRTAIHGQDQSVTISTKVVVADNYCLCGSPAAGTTVGVLLGTSTSAGNQDNVSIVNNAFYNFTLYDIATWYSGKIRIRDNECYSTAVSASIQVSGIPASRPVWIDGNVCQAAIGYDASAYASGLLQLDTNVVNATTESFGNPGSWTAQPFSAGDFTATGAMTWTVGSGNVDTFAWNIRGNVMAVSLVLATTTVGGTPDAALQIRIPAGRTATRHMVVPCFIIDSGVRSTGYLNISAGDTRIGVYRTDGANWSAASALTYVFGQIVFEVQ